MNEFFIKPVEKSGLTLKVKDPETGKSLSANGERKPKNQYWLRRLRTGDVVEGDETSEKQSNDVVTQDEAMSAAPNNDEEESS